MKIFRAAMAAVNIHTLWYTIINVIVFIKYVPEWFQFRAVAEKGRESARAGGGEREREEGRERERRERGSRSHARARRGRRREARKREAGGKRMAEEEELVDYEEEEEQAPADQANGKVRREIRRRKSTGGWVEVCSSVRRVRAEKGKGRTDAFLLDSLLYVQGGEAVKRGYVGIHSSGFKDFLLKPELLRALSDCGFEHPSEGTDA